MMMVMMGYSLSDLFENGVKDLNTKIEKINNNQIEIKATLKNLVLMHQEFMK